MLAHICWNAYNKPMHVFKSFCVFMLVPFLCYADISQVCWKKTCIDVEVARTRESQMKGLMFRLDLAKNHGMLFVFSDLDRHQFWMGNTYISLDIIWLSRDRKVLDIQENASPCMDFPCQKYSTDYFSQYALEVPAGTVARTGLKRRDYVEFRFDKKEN